MGGEINSDLAFDFALKGALSEEGFKKKPLFIIDRVKAKPLFISLSHP